MPTIIKRKALQYLRRQRWERPRARLRRSLLTLAIESSCDDSCVAILEKCNQPHPGRPQLQVHHHAKVTSNNLAFQGVHPLEALHSHQENLARLTREALQNLPRFPKAADGTFSLGDAIQITTDEDTSTFANVQKPDFITVTRGPGMRSNLNAGLDLAKGMAVAWNRPLVAVNHMLAHALTPRLVTAMGQFHKCEGYEPSFPFLSLLVSGGHTMLLHSKSLTYHSQAASTIDIALGDAIDKIATYVLPSDVLDASITASYGPALEQFAFPQGAADHNYTPPRTRAEEIDPYTSPEGWSLGRPMASSKSASRPNQLDFSFSGFCSSVKRAMKHLSEAGQVDIDQRRELAVAAMRLAFENLAMRVRIVLDQTPGIETLVVSGGVASNQYLRTVLRRYLDELGYRNVKLSFPPLELCVDNAVMIAWAGIEMFEHGWHSDLSVRSMRKWSLDPTAEDGGILGVPGWLSRERLP